jgi:23S rRNA (adenine-N6)-dimethyltransferase
MNNFSVSQNFLVNQDLISKLILLSGLSKDEYVLDIGVGKGIISNELIKLGYKVVGFEADKNLALNLNPEIKNNPSFRLQDKDFLEVNLKELGNFSVWANIPFNQTTKICQKLLIGEPLGNKISLILQEEAALRLQGVSEGLLVSLLILNNYESKISYRFKKTDFSPKPRVNSVLIEFIKRPKALVADNHLNGFLDFISFVIMQQRPSIEERLLKMLKPSRLNEFLTLLKIDKRQSLYQIDKLKYFQMCKLFFEKYPNQITIIKGSYKKYQEINSKNQKVYRTRLAQK